MNDPQTIGGTSTTPNRGACCQVGRTLDLDDPAVQAEIENAYEALDGPTEEDWLRARRWLRGLRTKQ